MDGEQSEVQELLAKYQIRAFIRNAWNKHLKEELEAEGLLKIDKKSSNRHPASDLVTDGIQLREQVFALCRALERSGFHGMAKSLLMDTDSVDDLYEHVSVAGSNYSTPRSQSMSGLRSSLRRSENRARQWEQRAMELEATQDLMTQWLKESTLNENQTAMEVGLLKEKEVLLESKLVQRASGLKQCKFQEKQKQKEIERLEKRIEELTQVLRSRDAELDRMKVQHNKYEEQISSWKTRASNKRKGLAEVPEHRLKLPHQQRHGEGGVKLPTLVHAFVKVNGSSDSVSTSDHSRFPAVDIGNGSKKSQTAVFKHVKQCMVHEAWVSVVGQHFQLPNVAVTFPPNAFQTSHYISVVEYPKDTDVVKGLKATGLHKYLELCGVVGIQPYNAKVSKNILIEVKNAHAFSQSKILVCSKRVNHQQDAEWTEGLSGALAKLSGDHALYHVKHTGLFATFRILISSPDSSSSISYSNGMGLRPHLCHTDIKHQAVAVLNGQHAACVFHVFVNNPDKTFLVLCDFPSDAADPDPPEDLEELDDLPYLGSCKVNVELCVGELIYPFINGEPLPGEEFAMEMPEYQDNGVDVIHQLIDISYEHAPHQLEKPATGCFELKRKVANVETVSLCRFEIPDISDLGKLKRSPVLRALTAAEVIARYEDKVIKLVDVRYLLETLKKQHVLTGEESFYISQGNSREARARTCLKILTTKDDRSIQLFIQALKTEYANLAYEMNKHFGR